MLFVLFSHEWKTGGQKYICMFSKQSEHFLFNNAFANHSRCLLFNVRQWPRYVNAERQSVSRDAHKVKAVGRQQRFVTRQPAPYVRYPSCQIAHQAPSLRSPPHKHFRSQSLDMHRLRARLRGSSLLIRGLVSKLPLFPRKCCGCQISISALAWNERRQIFGVTRVNARRQLFNVLHKDTSTCCWERLRLEPPTFFFSSSEDSLIANSTSNDCRV